MRPRELCDSDPKALEFRIVGGPDRVLQMAQRLLPDETENQVGSPLPISAKRSSAFDFAFESIDGTPLPLMRFAGRVLLVVNTASLCGFTRQYGGLQTLWQTYAERGLVILAVPSNDFGNQEPGSATEIETFCETKYRVEFPLTSKTQVSGADAHPFYRWAKRELGIAAAPRWNFHKYLVGRDGELVGWFSTMTSPTSKRVVRAVEGALDIVAASTRD